MGLFAPKDSFSSCQISAHQKAGSNRISVEEPFSDPEFPVWVEVLSSCTVRWSGCGEPARWPGMLLPLFFTADRWALAALGMWVMIRAGLLLPSSGLSKLDQNTRSRVCTLIPLPVKAMRVSRLTVAKARFGRKLYWYCLAAHKREENTANSFFWFHCAVIADQMGSCVTAVLNKY